MPDRVVLPSSNWRSLHAKIAASADGKKKRKRSEGVPPTAAKAAAAPPAAPAPAPAPAVRAPHNAAASSTASPAPPIPLEPVNIPEAASARLALDAEMVGVGDGGKRSALARVVVVSFDERICYHAFVKPPEPVTDWRTFVSGVRPQHMRYALPLRQVQTELAGLLRDRTIIGHAIQNDFRAFMLDHPSRDVRDTATYPAYRKVLAGGGTRPRKLQALAREHLQWEIQGDEHSPAEDAVAALRLYKLHMSEWERALNAGRRGPPSAQRREQQQQHTQTTKWEQRAGKPRKLKRGNGGGKRQRLGK